jgi:hypothetical protein
MFGQEHIGRDIAINGAEGHGWRGTQEWPEDDECRTKTDCQIPVVVLTRA